MAIEAENLQMFLQQRIKKNFVPDVVVIRKLKREDIKHNCIGLKSGKINRETLSALFFFVFWLRLY